MISLSEVDCEIHFIRKTQHQLDGRFVVSLPLKIVSLNFGNTLRWLRNGCTY